MKERLILFSGQMVRAILDGRKTQTRRLRDKGWKIGDRLWVQGKSRINLEITGKRKERLQDISAKDVESEGLDVASKLPVFAMRGKLAHVVNRIAKDMFSELWDSLYGKIEGKRWEDNPNVWVYEFKRVN